MTDSVFWLLFGHFLDLFRVGPVPAQDMLVIENFQFAQTKDRIHGMALSVVFFEVNKDHSPVRLVTRNSAKAPTPMDATGTLLHCLKGGT